MGGEGLLMTVMGKGEGWPGLGVRARLAGYRGDRRRGECWGRFRRRGGGGLWRRGCWVSGRRVLSSYAISRY